MAGAHHILVVEDDQHIGEMLVDHLRHSTDATVRRSASACETLRLDVEQPPDLLLTDILLPDGNGIDLVRLIRSTRTYPVVFITGEPTFSRAVEALRLGACDFFAKPFDLQRLTAVVKQALADHDKFMSQQARLKKLEELTHTVVEERAELQQRVDLVCKDLVGAYRDLAARFNRQFTSEPDTTS